MKVLLVQGTCLKFGPANVVLLADTTVEFPTVHNPQQMAETLFAGNLLKIDENLANLAHTIEEVRVIANPFDIDDGVKRELVTSLVTYGANGVAIVDELETRPADEVVGGETVTANQRKTKRESLTKSR